MPNHNQIPIYFIQQCYVHAVLKKRVDWTNKHHLSGTGKGRPSEKKRAREENRIVEDNRPRILHPETMQALRSAANTGQPFLERGITFEEVESDLERLRQEIIDKTEEISRKDIENNDLRDDIKNKDDIILNLQKEVTAYRSKYGELDIDAPSQCNDSQVVQNVQPSFDKFHVEELL